MVIPTIEKGDCVYHMNEDCGMGVVISADKFDEIAYVEWSWGNSWEYFGDLMLIN